MRKSWFRRLLNWWEMKRYEPPCRGCLLLTACTAKNDTCDKLNMAIIRYMHNKYSGFCAYCGGNIRNTGETEWFRGCIPPMLCSKYRCDTCTFSYGVGGV
jgi:hypothetical protein